MDDIRSKIDNKIKNLAKIINLFEDFDKNKEYKNKGFLKKLSDQIYDITKNKLSNKSIYNMLEIYLKNKSNLNKILNAKSYIYKTIDENYEMKGGFLSNEYDNKFTKMLNLIDFLLDIIKFIPNNILTSNNLYVGLPYGIISILLNLFRNNYDFAFYSFIGVIPGLGNLIGASMKIIHRIINFITTGNKIIENKKYYKNIQSARLVHDFLKDDKYEKINNPYLGTFEDKYKSEYLENI
tara:strand:- start:176 stop:889 length:714 start_codon:yes stop_codon:yes gene_type:complete